MTLNRCGLAAALLCASAASAAADMGTLDLSSGSTFFGNTPTFNGSVPFSDTWDFVLPPNGTYALDASITSASNGDQDVDFFSIVLFQASTFLGFTELSGDPFETWSLAANLRPGSWRLVLTGLNSAGMGSYAGNIAVSLLPVPEPSSRVLLLAGLGALCGLVRLKLSARGDTLGASPSGR